MNSEHPNPPHPQTPQRPLPGPGITQDIFQAVGATILDNIPRRADHPTWPKGVINPQYPLATNKFYGNFTLSDQHEPTWTHPYSVTWSKGRGNAGSWGLAISHIDPDQKVLGPPQTGIPGTPSKFYFNPVGIQSVILSASELGNQTLLSTDSLKAFSVNLNLQPGTGGAGRITFPLLQGMGFVTGRYSNLQPAIQSSVFFRVFTPKASPKPGVFKYQVTLEDNKTWLLYVTPDNGVNPNLQHVSNVLIRGPAGFTGTIQVAKNSSGAPGEQMYDDAAGAYPTDARITGSVTGTSGQYTFQWTKSGVGSSTLVMFALPHHVASFDTSTANRKTAVQLATTTKGMATAIVGESWTLIEPNLPTAVGFAPWAPGTVFPLSTAAKLVIKNVASSEISANFDADIYKPGNGMYFGGKRIHKYARMVYTMHELLADTASAAVGLTKLKNSFDRVVRNHQPAPLAYDEVWRGIVSTAGYGPGQQGAEFGNTVYNDHHFHYGYWIHTAALIAHLDPTWLTVENKNYVNILVKDACNSITDGQFFPFSRAFDWYHGHSWAHGTTPFADGKDQESTSEDANFAYALKMWGKVSGDKSMEARGNLMLSILARSVQTYFLMDSANTIHPREFIGNKVTGILFENKCDHTTFFGDEIFKIQGIHMLPIIPCSPLVRTKGFVREEWDVFFANGGVQPARTVDNGWKSILYQNLALIDARASWDFFAQSSFQPGWLDDGASRTWALVYAAGLGGGP